MEIEAKHGFSICDTDPFKSHFDWSMAKAGFTTMDVFNAAMPMARDAILRRKLGFCDLYLVKHIAPEIARAQKENDSSRTRSRFEMHLELQPYLRDWFETLSEVLPERVKFGFPKKHELIEKITSKLNEESPHRFNVSVLDAFLKRLSV